jgi:hypothetical protein
MYGFSDGLLAPMLLHHAHCTFPDFSRKFVRLVHGSIYMDASRLQGISSFDVTGTVRSFISGLAAARSSAAGHYGIR